MVYMLLGTGFEETEAVAPLDLLRRAGVDVLTVGIDGKTVSGSHKIKVEADITIGEMDLRWSHGSCGSGYHGWEKGYLLSRPGNPHGQRHHAGESGGGGGWQSHHRHLCRHCDSLRTGAGCGSEGKRDCGSNQEADCHSLTGGYRNAF